MMLDIQQPYTITMISIIYRRNLLNKQRDYAIMSDV